MGQASQAEAKIAEEELNRTPAPSGTGFFADCAEISEAMDSSTAGFLGVHASRNVFRNLLVEVEVQLGVQFGAGAGAAESGKLCPKFMKPTHKAVFA